MSLFTGTRLTREEQLELAKKVTKKTPASNSGGATFQSSMESIKIKVSSLLSKYEKDCAVYYATDDLEEYFEKCITNGIVVVDTETEGLDALHDKIAGLCLYTPNEKAIYVPINHKSSITGARVKNQVEIPTLKKLLEKLIKNKVKFIYHNACFDIRVILNNIGVELPVYWDTLICATLLDENEDHGLKRLYIKYIDNTEPFYEFSYLFPKTIFTKVPIQYAFVYAARDTYITYKLYEYQKNLFSKDSTLSKLYKLYREVEIPVIPVTVSMENTGIKLNKDTCKKLELKYKDKLKEPMKNLDILTEEYKQEIIKANKKGLKIGFPVNWKSSTQVAVLLYDILKIPVIDKKKPRGTGKEILDKIDNPIAKELRKVREIDKLLDTYLVNLPKAISPKTNRIHGTFNQLGTDTGRFSSSNPNMQNIPSKAKDIRTIFEAEKGNVLISSDFSSQEPRIATHMCGDKRMIKAFEEGKELYSVIASIAFKMPYEECLEFRPNGDKNPEGYKRRNIVKAIFLGVLYSKQVPSIAKDLNIPKDRAQKIFDKVMDLFPSLPPLIEGSLKDARTKGFVETIWGRRRRLPEVNNPKFVFNLTKGSKLFNPLDFSSVTGISKEFVDKYSKILEKCKYRNDSVVILNKLLKDGIEVVDNRYTVAEYERKCLNARVQGSAADQSKKAMILVHNNKRLKELGFKLLLSVHDELIGEVPIKNHKEAGEIFSNLMVEAGKDLIVPSKCDVEVMIQWNGPSYKGE